LPPGAPLIQLARIPTDKSFLVLFFKKEHSFFLTFKRAPTHATPSANEDDDLPAAPERNGVPLLPVSTPTAQVTLDLVHALHDVLP